MTLNKRQFVPYHMEINSIPPEHMTDDEYDRAQDEMLKAGHGDYGKFCIDHGHQFAAKLRKVGLEPQVWMHSGASYGDSTNGCQECMYGGGPDHVIT